MNLPTIESRNGNYFRVGVGNLTVWFSYKTPIAFQVGGHSPAVRQNAWGPTTDTHLNLIDGGEKASRIPGAAFEELLAAAMPGE